jgi:endo-1,4-beta-xylanase
MKTLPLMLAPLLVAATPLSQLQEIESLDTLYKVVGKIYSSAATEKARLDEEENASIIKSRFGSHTRVDDEME